MKAKLEGVLRPRRVALAVARAFRGNIPRLAVFGVYRLGVRIARNYRRLR
jgi:hypothetical protein